MVDSRHRILASAVLFAVAVAAVAWVTTHRGGESSVQTTPRAGATSVAGDQVGFSPGAGILWAPAAEQDRELDLMRATGAHWLRLDFPWPSVEPQDGAWNWAPFDQIVSKATARGFEIVGIPGYTPSWAARTPSAGEPPADAAAYADLVGHLAERYGPKGVHVWELWNEPNLKGAWGASPDAVAYTVLLRQGAAAARAKDPMARILSGGLAPAVDAPDKSEISPVTFVQRIYSSGGGTSLDGVAIHPYSYPAAPIDPSTADWNTFQRLPLVHQVMVDHGDGNKPVWLTEYGAPTGTSRAAVPADLQAAFVKQALLAADAWPWTGPIFWYAARDTGTDLTDPEQNFGLVRHDFEAKPAYAAFVSTVDPVAKGSPSFLDEYFPLATTPGIIRSVELFR